MTIETRSSDPDVDRSLQDYFQAEVPHPWPASPVQVNPLSRRRGYGEWARLALVASIGLLLAGYITLASFFPRPSNNPVHPGQNPHIGQRPVAPK